MGQINRVVVCLNALKTFGKKKTNQKMLCKTDFLSSFWREGLCRGTYSVTETLKRAEEMHGSLIH